MKIYEYIAEQKIREAISKGEFDHLDGFGKPVDNTEYFSVPAEERMAYHILKNAGIVPEEVEIRKSIYQLTQKIRKTVNKDELSSLEKRKQWLEDRLFVLADNKLNKSGNI